MDANFFVAIGFAIFAYLLYKHAWPGFIGLLDARVASVKDKFDRNAKEQKELEEKEIAWRNSLRELPAEIEESRSNAEREFKLLAASMEKEAAEKRARRQDEFQQALRRIERHGQAVLLEKLANAAFERVEAILRENPAFLNEYTLMAAETLKNSELDA